MITLRESKKLIYDCYRFSKEDWSSTFILKYIDSVPDWSYTWKDWKEYTRFKDETKSYFLDKSKLPENYQKLEDKKICQDLKGKSIVITTSLWD